MKNWFKIQNKLTIFKNKNFTKSQLTIFKNSLFLTLKSKFYIITTTIFFIILLIIGLLWSQLFFANEANDSAFLKTFGFWFYVITCMCYLFIFNLTNLIKFFGEQKQNGIYDLELRKGKSSKSIFWQRLIANKVFSFSFIVLAIILYYIIFAFTKNPDIKNVMINLFAPGLWFLVVFDSLITALILLFSLGNKIALTASLISIFSIILFFFPLFMTIASGTGDNGAQLTMDGQISLYYAKNINTVRNKYKNGIIDKMILGDSQTSNFAALTRDEWEVTSGSDDSMISLGVDSSDIDIKFNFNTQLLFNGLIPDSKALLSDVGVLEKNQDRELVVAKYASKQEENGLTQAQSTYFNQFFEKIPSLFQENGQGYSYEEWQKTIFNVEAETSFNSVASEKVIFINSAEDYLTQTMNEIDKNLLTNEEKSEWAELRPIIIEAFKTIYVSEFERNAFGNTGYLVKNNVFKKSASENIRSINKFVLGPNGDTEFGFSNEGEWYWPVLTMNNGINNPKLTEFQEKLFQKMKIKPGTRELMSIMAALISNSLVVPQIFDNETQNFTAADIHKTQTNKFLLNPFSWINSMLAFNKPNLSFIDQLRVQQNFTVNEATSLRNYYVQVQETDKFSDFVMYPDLINEEENNNANFNWQDIEVVKVSFSPLWALLGSLLVNIAMIGFSYWLFKITLIK